MGLLQINSAGSIGSSRTEASTARSDAQKAEVEAPKKPKAAILTMASHARWKGDVDQSEPSKMPKLSEKQHLSGHRRHGRFWPFTSWDDDKNKGDCDCDKKSKEEGKSAKGKKSKEKAESEDGKEDTEKSEGKSSKMAKKKKAEESSDDQEPSEGKS